MGRISIYSSTQTWVHSTCRLNKRVKEYETREYSPRLFMTCLAGPLEFLSKQKIGRISGQKRTLGACIPSIYPLPLIDMVIIVIEHWFIIILDRKVSRNTMYTKLVLYFCIHLLKTTVSKISLCTFLFYFFIYIIYSDKYIDWHDKNYNKI
jgi:hypothetical protein